jgi:hypothetical protein
MKKAPLIVGALTLALSGFSAPAESCTNLIVTKGASADGSVMITYTCDGEFHPRLSVEPAADHGPDEWIELKDWSGAVRGKIKQATHTYAVVDLMNEHQLVIGETTFTGREELENPDGLLHYWWLMRLALQRAKTAREAVEVMAALVEEYGYASTGESISIGDPNEAWLMEIIGPGPGGVSTPRASSILRSKRDTTTPPPASRSISARPTAPRTCRSSGTRKRGFGASSAERLLRGSGRSITTGASKAHRPILSG